LVSWRRSRVAGSLRLPHGWIYKDDSFLGVAKETRGLGKREACRRCHLLPIRPPSIRRGDVRARVTDELEQAQRSPSSEESLLGQEQGKCRPFMAK
jgi:hypothetical protein